MAIRIGAPAAAASGPGPPGLRVPASQGQWEPLQAGDFLHQLSRRRRAPTILESTERGGEEKTDFFK